METTGLWKFTFIAHTVRKSVRSSVIERTEGIARDQMQRELLDQHGMSVPKDQIFLVEIIQV